MQLWKTYIWYHRTLQLEASTEVAHFYWNIKWTNISDLTLEASNWVEFYEWLPVPVRDWTQTMKCHDSTTPWKLIVREKMTPHIILSANASDKSRTTRLAFLYFLVSWAAFHSSHLLLVQDFGDTERREAGAERHQGLGTRLWDGRVEVSSREAL